MTITSNIFVGITAWASSTSYSVGNRRSNGGNAYQCIKAGTSASSGGPSGTGTSIADGSAAWKFLATVDYVTMGSWASGVPGTLSQPVVALIWNCGSITTTVGTAFFTLTGHTTTSTNNITIKAAPGDSFRDTLAANFSQALFSGSSLGVSFVLPSSGVGGINYIGIYDANVILDGLQFIDPNSASGSTILQIGNSVSGCVIRNCIFDGYSQVGGASILDLEATVTVANTLVLDRMSASDDAVTVFSSETVKLVNSTFISLNSNTAGGMLLNSATGTYVRNCAVFGYSVLLIPSSTAATFDHCGTNVASLASPITDGGSNKLSLTAANQFVSATADFRLKLGSALIGAGVSDTTDIPTSDDIAGHSRSGWDIGSWAYFLQSSAAVSFTVMRASGTASLTTITNQAQGSSSLLTISAAGAAAQNNRLSGSGRIMAMLSSATLGGRDLASAVCNIGGNPWSSGFGLGFGPYYSFVNARGSASLTQPASAAVALISFSAVGRASDGAAGIATILSLSVVGAAAQLGGVANIMSLSATATAVPQLLFSGAVNLDFLSFGQMTSATSASGTAGLLAIQSASSLIQRDLASGSATFFAVTGGGAIGSSMSARTSILSLACVASASEFNGASCRVTFDVLAVHKPIPPLLKSDAISPLTLAADGSGLLLAADVLQQNITSQTFCSGTSSLPALSCSASALFQIFASSSNALAFSASSLMQQNSLASGIATIPALRCAASTVLRDVASGIAALQRLTAVGIMSQAVAVSGLATIPAIGSSGAAQGFDLASGTATLSFSASGLALASGTAIGRATTGAIGATGVASFALGITARATIALTAIGQAAQIASASGSATIQTSVSGVANQHIFSSGLAALPALTASGTMASANRASGSGIIPSLSANGSAVNTNNPAQEIATVLALQASGASILHGVNMSGSATITFVGSGAMAQEVAASVLVELEQIVAAHAKLWTTPVGYESGDLIVYWPD